MRFWIVALMIALLPLRGWVGDAMALERLAPASQAHSAVASLVHDCHEASTPEHAQHADGHDAAGHGDQTSPHSHLSCDLCNVPALHPPTLVLAADIAPNPLRVLAHERFASTEPQRDRKPPIA